MVTGVATVLTVERVTHTATGSVPPSGKLGVPASNVNVKIAACMNKHLVAHAIMVRSQISRIMHKITLLVYIEGYFSKHL